MLHKYKKNQLAVDENDGNYTVTTNRTHCHCGHKYEVYCRIENKHNLMNVCSNRECYSFIDTTKLTTWIPISQKSPIPEITTLNI